MNNADLMPFAIGAVIGVVVLPLLAAIARLFVIEVDDEEAVLVTSFGKLTRELSRPGLHSLPARALPWVRTRRVSLQRDFRHFRNIHVNDARGTTVLVDLWLEFRIVAPAKALFAITDWDGALQHLVAHAATSILGSREFYEILCDRTELGERLRRDIEADTARWGLRIESIFIRNVQLLPEVSRQLFEAVAARLEREQAYIDEEGRLRIAALEAETSVSVAALVAEAKGQYPDAVGRAFAALHGSPAVLRAYNELYELSLLRPHRTVVFRGFENNELRAVDAAMLTAPPADGAGSLPTQPHALASLGTEESRWRPGTRQRPIADGRGD